MKKILFLGGMFPKEMREIENKSKGNIQNAANVLQWNIIEGILENKEECSLLICSALFVGSWPLRFKDLFVKNRSLENDGHEVEYISFLNLPVVKNISRFFASKSYMRKWLHKNKGDDLYVIIYSAHTPFIVAINKLKKKYDFKVHLIVPDLPQYMNLSAKNNLIYNVLKKVDIGIINCNISGVDSFTFLTDDMSKVLNKFNKRYIVVEGMVNVRDREKIEYSDATFEKTVVYTGGMSEKYGVKQLVEASKYFDEGIKLILCGTGELDHYIISEAKKRRNIIFKGQVSRQEVLRIQAKATILTNPRQNNAIYTKYSFPSKNLEYMLWGKPVLVFKLDGIPDAYDDVLMYYESGEVAEIAKQINEICKWDKEKRDAIGEKSMKFVLNKKNNLVQTDRILKCMFEIK